MGEDEQEERGVVQYCINMKSSLETPNTGICLHYSSNFKLLIICLLCGHQRLMAFLGKVLRSILGLERDEITE
jgi:hypothetical protein